jgi:hypothetical protein
VFFPLDYSWIAKMESECLPWADWQRKENLAKFDGIVLEFAASAIKTAFAR